MIPKKLSLVALLLAMMSGCSTLPPMEAVDVTQEGWTRKRGQAVWKFGDRAPELVGELMVAVHEDGRLFVEFTKSVVTVASARTDNEQWIFELPMYDRTLSGRGAPSHRFALFQFGLIVRGQSLPSNWEYQGEASGWRLANPSTGEYLEGYWVE